MSNKAQADIGILGGSGLYDMEGLSSTRWVSVSTPFGDPSDDYLVGQLEGRSLAFLPRHGRGHRLMPSDVNYRANIYGFKSLGVRWLIAVSAVGSLKEEYAPRHIVLPDQFFDRTKFRTDTFFGEGLVAHIAFADPVCVDLVGVLYDAARAAGATMHKGGTYLNMEGPAFSTRAESNVYRRLGFDVIGMTNLAEAKLAREAEMCYATMAMVTDYDCWRVGEEDVNVEAVITVLKENAEMARTIIRHAVGNIPAEQTCPCARALENAILTARDKIPAATKKRLRLLVKKYL